MKTLIDWPLANPGWMLLICLGLALIWYYARENYEKIITDNKRNPRQHSSVYVFLWKLIHWTLFICFLVALSLFLTALLPTLRSN